MDSGIIIALIASFSALFASIMTFIGILYNFRKPKKYSVLEMQLSLVFSPIHNILSIHEELSDEQKKEMIDKIIKENYVLVHPNIYKLFYNKNNKAFYEQIDKCYSYTRSKLGYDQIKGIRYDTLTKKLVATNSVNMQTLFVTITGMFVILVCLSNVFLSNQLNFAYEYNSTSNDILATTNVNLAADYYILGEYDIALEYYHKALVVKEKLYGIEHPDIADIYCDIGYMYDDLGEHVKAIHYYQKGLYIYKKILGEKHSKTISTEKRLQDLNSDK